MQWAIIEIGAQRQDDAHPTARVCDGCMNVLQKMNAPYFILYQREKLFKWVGPITDLTMGLVGLKTNSIKLQSIEDADKYRIGTIRDGAPEQLVLAAGIEESNLERIASPEANIKKLHAGRIHAQYKVFDDQTGHGSG